MARVLIIDDDMMITRLLEEHLSNEGHTVTSAHMAEEGFEKALAAPPELIFLDVMLPDATGFQMVGRLRQNPVTQSIPIILMTGTARFPNQQEIGKAMGANEYILKPFDVIDVGERVNRLIQMKRLSEPIPLPFQSAAPPEPNAPQTFQTAVHESFHGDDDSIPLEIARGPASPFPAEWAGFQPMEKPFQQPIAEIPPPLEAGARAEPAPDEDAVPNPQEKPERIPDASAERPAGLTFAAGMFIAHLLIAGVAADAQAGVLQTAALTAGGWALLLGLLSATCAVLRIRLESREALRILGWSSIPIILKTAGGILGLPAHPEEIPALIYWLRPLDIFEIAAVVALSLSLRRLPGGSLVKSIFASVMIAAAWSLAGRGYFRPF